MTLTEVESMEKKMKIILAAIIAIIIVGSLFAAYTMDIIEFDEDDDDDNGDEENKVDLSPIAIVTANRTQAEVQGSVMFDGSSSYDNDDNITTYSWNFGDGITADNVTSNHSYLEAGVYNVTLTVTDAAGNINSTSMYFGVVQREDEAGDIQQDSVTHNFDVTEMPVALYVNTTLENNFIDPFSTDIDLSLWVNGTVVWNQTAESTQTESTWPYFLDTNITAGTWTWELTIQDDALPEDVSWTLEVVVFYGGQQN